MKPILTIAIPTYNRSGDLARLLAVLQREVQPLADEIQVHVSDNASTDGTSGLIASTAERWPALKIRRNPTNVGPDRNFCLIVEQIETRYFWIMGDDDVPKLGAVARILNILAREKPALLYMQSEWRKQVDPGTATPDDIHYRLVDRKAFAREVHLWMTFISGMVIDRSALGGADLRRHVGTFLVQLGWVLPALASADRFVVVDDPCVVATQDNSGGYGVLTVFATNFPRIVRDSFSSQPKLAEQIIDAAMGRALPALVWTTREKAEEDPSARAPWQEIRKMLGRKPRFWLILLPLGAAPLPVARLFREGLRLSDRVRAKAARAFPRKAEVEGAKSIGAFPTDPSRARLP